MYNRSQNYASGFFIILGGIIIGLLIACSLDWSIPADIESRLINHNQLMSEFDEQK